MNKAVFLDRDGVINQLIVARGPRETPTTPGEFTLLPGVTNSLARLKRAGYLLIIVTNQPNVAKGKTTLKSHNMIHQKMIKLIGHGLVDRIYVCLHHPDPAQVVVPELLQECDCRKPKPGMVLQAQADYQLSLEDCWLVGDAETDMEAGCSAGIPPEHLILVGKYSTITSLVVTGLPEATDRILGA